MVNSTGSVSAKLGMSVEGWGGRRKMFGAGQRELKTF